MSALMSDASALAARQGPPPPSPVPPPHGRGKLVPLAIGALGIVYGDIGTSPLYALKECFAKIDGKVAPHAMAVSHDSVLGILSLVFWALTLVVAVKYLTFIMRADNKGEGGMFALLALLPDRQRKSTAVAVMAGLFGASLLYGEGIITPGISVLSAVEGLSVGPADSPVSHAMDGVVLPLTLVILTGLFLVQKRGTGDIGRLFGPVMFVWFVVIAALGVRSIATYPEVLSAVNPMWALQLFLTNPWHAFVVLGSVVLCITGGEALYADMGHFGAKAIRVSWFAMVFPSLLLNYFGQGAFLLSNGWVENPFYEIVPRPLLYPMVALATAAAVIASQALISGAFSLTRQAVQLGFMPRVTIVHTSAENAGQIYVPEVNYALMMACLALVLIFQKSSALTAAYGIAVTGTMTITSVVFYFVATRTWKWPAWKAAPLVLFFLCLDIPFFLANTLKFFQGGWVPTVIGISMFALMTTWKRGRAELAGRFNQSLMPLSALLEDLEATKPFRVRGTAVFMSGNSEGTPPVLLHHLKHNQVLHRQVVLLSIVPCDVPTVPKEDQIEVKEQGNGFFRVIWKSGFMETPNVPQILLRARVEGLVCEPSTTSYFLGRETLLTSGKSPMMLWRKLLFAFVSRNALSATSYFGLPPGRVVELGMQVDL